MGVGGGEETGEMSRSEGNGAATTQEDSQPVAQIQKQDFSTRNGWLKDRLGPLGWASLSPFRGLCLCTS